MLKDIIEMELYKIMDKPNPDREVPEDVAEATEKFQALYNKLKSINFELANEMDCIDGEIRAAYSGMFFELGFRKALALCNEMKGVC